ncbi:hypothetical protein [Ferribacterium limneticum]|uniref:hypothetical protein n=1 Tax=Ferribacterium limneticum TaxID=76259 RepID=UPI001CF8D6F4|nr:hypothetical protein [Ferribacterium limneticum]UCV26760.1 hypothetical protein KI617_10605 [Ferribacterium limneticum]UCV30677.1 hypothetical protein KI608_10605 [Ferribacterium limneticum]
MPNIYPIQLGANHAEALIKQHLYSEFREATYLHSSRFTEYFFYGELLADGEVKLSVSHNSDDGFCMSSGPCFKGSIRPFDKKAIASLEGKAKWRIAREEYERRQLEAEIAAVTQIMDEMFGVKP